MLHRKANGAEKCVRVPSGFARVELAEPLSSDSRITSYNVCYTTLLRVPEISVPRRVYHVDEIPVLGTGKVDYGTVQKQAVDLVEA